MEISNQSEESIERGATKQKNQSREVQCNQSEECI